MRETIDDLFDKYLGEEDTSRRWDWDDLWEIDGPMAFEDLIADLWEDMGYRTTRTRGSGDDGADVVATRDGIIRNNIETVVIEVKHYGGDNTVGSDVVRALPGAQQMHEADMSVIVTSNIFTDAAKETAEKLNVELVNGKELIRRLNQSDLPPPELEFL